MAAAGIGVLIAFPVSRLLVDRRSLMVPLAVAPVLFGAPLLVIAVLPEPALAFGLIALWGLGAALADATMSSLLFRIVAGPQIARVVGAIESLKLALGGAGALSAPVLVGLFGVRGAIACTGALPFVLLAAEWRGLRRVDDVAARRVERRASGASSSVPGAPGGCARAGRSGAGPARGAGRRGGRAPGRSARTAVLPGRGGTRRRARGRLACIGPGARFIVRGEGAAAIRPPGGHGAGTDTDAAAGPRPRGLPRCRHGRAGRHGPGARPRWAAHAGGAGRAAARRPVVDRPRAAHARGLGGARPRANGSRRRGRRSRGGPGRPLLCAARRRGGRVLGANGLSAPSRQTITSARSRSSTTFPEPRPSAA